LGWVIFKQQTTAHLTPEVAFGQASCYNTPMSLLSTTPEINYTVRHSTRCRHARLTITSDKKLIVTLPKNASATLAEKIITEHRPWILRHLLRSRPNLITLPKGQADYMQNKTSALTLVRERIQFFNAHYHLTWKRISIKNASTRWGSCSRLKNLNFNYKIIYLPPELQEYLIVHELCHLQEMNHSKKFWQLVAQTIPQQTQCRRALRKYSL